MRRARPRFSLVIPTRNRCALLARALRSACAQEYDDYEIVVSGNACDDDTAKVMESCGDARVRYVRTPKYMLMHESWEFALTQARGAYVGVLCDDDALHPAALRAAAEAIDATGADALAWRAASYMAEDWAEESARGRVHFGPPYTDAWFALEPDELLRCARNVSIDGWDWVPKGLNGLMSAELIERARADAGRICAPSCPDFSIMTLIAAHAERIVMLDAPLLIAGATPQSVGASGLTQGDVARAFGDELRRCEPDMVVPPALGTTATYLGQTYLQCARESKTLSAQPLNMVRMYARALRELRRQLAMGLAVDNFSRDLDEALSGALHDISAEVRALADAPHTLTVEPELRAVTGGGSVLGLGPWRCDDLNARESGIKTIDRIAERMDALIHSHGCSLRGVEDKCQRAANGRAIVLWGLGRNGRALHRVLAQAGAGSPTFIGVDARCAGPPRGVELVDADTIRPDAHYVVWTPGDAARAGDAMKRAGMIAGRDWRLLSETGTPFSNAVSC
jgi:hypothetical protein